jgi:hypothetical protein
MVLSTALIFSSAISDSLGSLFGEVIRPYWDKFQWMGKRMKIKMSQRKWQAILE